MSKMVFELEKRYRIVTTGWFGRTVKDNKTQRDMYIENPMFVEGTIKEDHDDVVVVLDVNGEMTTVVKSQIITYTLRAEHKA